MLGPDQTIAQQDHDGFNVLPPPPNVQTLLPCFTTMVGGVGFTLTVPCGPHPTVCRESFAEHEPLVCGLLCVEGCCSSSWRHAVGRVRQLGVGSRQTQPCFILIYTWTRLEPSCLFMQAQRHCHPHQQHNPHQCSSLVAAISTAVQRQKASLQSSFLHNAQWDGTCQHKPPGAVLPSDLWTTTAQATD